MATVIKYKNDKGHKAEFVLTKYLGGGAFGQVYLCHLRRCHINLDFPPTLACKSITFRSEEELEWIKEREVKLCGVSEGKNLIKMYAVVKDEDKVYFFFHFYNGGMLSQLIKLKAHIDEKLAARIIEQILKGLIELHDKGIIHRDLKPDNILLHFECMNPNENVSKGFIEKWDYKKHCVFSVIIADLGCGREIDIEMTAKMGTPIYRAPEALGMIYDSTADIMSLGIILHELLFGEPLFSAKRAGSLAGLMLLWEVTNEYYNSNDTERKISYEAMQFLQYCLQKDSRNRLMADELYELDFIQKAYSDEEFTYPSEDTEYVLSLTSYSDFYKMS